MGAPGVPGKADLPGPRRASGRLKKPVKNQRRNRDTQENDGQGSQQTAGNNHLTPPS
jgi:hypothetical protein